MEKPISASEKETKEPEEEQRKKRLSGETAERLTVVFHCLFCLLGFVLLFVCFLCIYNWIPVVIYLFFFLLFLRTNFKGLSKIY